MRISCGLLCKGCDAFCGLTARPTCHRKQQTLVTKNRLDQPDVGLAVRAPHCQNSRSVVSGVVLIPTARHAWRGHACEVATVCSSLLERG